MFDRSLHRLVSARRIVARLCDPEAAPASLAGLDLPPLAAWEEWAIHQGVLPLVRAGLARRGGPPGPPELQARLDHGYFDAAFQHERACETAALAAAALDGAGVPFLLIKGPALALAYYPDPALRAARDLDLLVREADRPRAGAALEALGYALDRPEAAYRADVEMTQRLYLPAREQLLPVELHWHVVNSARLRRGLPAPTEDYLAHAATVAIGGRSLRTLGGADLLAYLAIHAAFQHQCNRLIWLVDILQVLRTLPDGALAAEGPPGARTALRACLRLVRALFPCAPRAAARPPSAGVLPELLASTLNVASVLVPDRGTAAWRRKLFREGLKSHAA